MTLVAVRYQLAWRHSQVWQANQTEHGLKVMIGFSKIRNVPLAIAILLLAFAKCGATEPSDAFHAATGVKQIIAHRGASSERPECTLAAVRRAIEVGATAVELDVRESRDGQLFILHDPTLDRTSNAKGLAGELTLAQLQQLDVGSWFDATYHRERIPSLAESVRLCRGRIDILIDLKQQGVEYDRKIAATIREHGEPARTIVGVRSVGQAKRFRELLPKARQLGLIPTVDAIEEFAAAGVETIRLWPRWIRESEDVVRRVAETGKQLHLNGKTGDRDETLQLLMHQPDSVSSDDPGRLVRTLRELRVTDFQTKEKTPAGR